MFSITEKASAMAPEDYGLINGHCTLNGWIEDVAEIRGFIAPPFFSPDKISFFILFSHLL